MRPLFYDRILGAVAALAAFGMISGAHAAVVLLPGSPVAVPTGVDTKGTTGVDTKGTRSALDPFRITFDENGNASIAVWNGTSYNPPTALTPIAGASFLAWVLPQRVVPGDVSFAEPPNAACTSASNCSDGLRFGPDGNTSFMAFYSDIEPGESHPALADTGFPTGFDFTSFQRQEVGPECCNGFTYVAGFDGPSSSNYYIGISDSIPEASTWAMAALGFAGLGFAGWRRAKNAAAIAL